jgi:hypothetical protein
VKQEHTIAIKWKEKKFKSEDRTVSDDNNDDEFHIRSISLAITP